MDKLYHVYIGRLDGWHTYRAAQSQTQEGVSAWLARGFRIQTEHQIGVRLHEVYLVPA